ncbi:hypothetical protein D3C80_1981370 [compost metagenome]
MQYIIGGRAQQQGQAVTAVATDHDQVAAVVLGQLVDFLARLAVGQVGIGAGQLWIFLFQALHALLGLVELLLLQL